MHSKAYCDFTISMVTFMAFKNEGRANFRLYSNFLYVRCSLKAQNFSIYFLFVRIDLPTNGLIVTSKEKLNFF